MGCESLGVSTDGEFEIALIGEGLNFTASKKAAYVFECDGEPCYLIAKAVDPYDSHRIQISIYEGNPPASAKER